MRWLIGLVLISAWGCSRGPDKDNKANSDGAAIETVRVAPAPAAQAPVDPNAPFPGSDRLASLLATLQSEGTPYGLTITLQDLRGRFETKASKYREGLSPHEGTVLGLMEPEMRDFDDADKAKRGPRFKWLDDQIRYGNQLPERGDNVSEAWARVYGFRDFSTGSHIIIQDGVAADKWRRMQWQAGLRRWSFYSESDERMGQQSRLDRLLAKPDTAAKRCFECERLERPMREAEAKGQDIRGYQGNMVRALLELHDRELEEAAGRFALEN